MPLSPRAATNLTATELELEIAANTVSHTVAVSLAATIALSVATTIGATVVASSSAAVVAGAATGGAGGGAVGAASGGGGACGMADVMTVLMAAQRLSVLASMPVDMSKIHARVGSTLAWTKGSLGLFSRIVSEETRRQFWGWQPIGDNSTEVAGGKEEAWLGALMGLTDTLATLAFALASVLLLQLLAHLLWKYLVNHRYYALRKQTKEQHIKLLMQGIVSASQPGSSGAGTAANSSPPSSATISSSLDTASNVGPSRQPTMRWAMTLPPPQPVTPLPPLSMTPPPPLSVTLPPPLSSSLTGGRRWEAAAVTSTQECIPVEGAPASPSGVDEEAGGGQGGSRDSPQPLTEAYKAALLKIKFRAFPSLLRWPTAPCFVCVCCLSGLLQGAFTILVTHQKTAPLHALAVGAVGAAISIGVLLLLWTQLVVFALRHARQMWVPEKMPTTPSEVADPALRLISTVRRRVLTSCSKQRLSPSIAHHSSVRIEQAPALHRARGAFAAYGIRNRENLEPRRTERLLANPLSLFPRTALDAYESVAVTVLFKSRGDLKHAMAYHLGQLTAQVTHHIKTCVHVSTFTIIAPGPPL